MISLQLESPSAANIHFFFSNLNLAFVRPTNRQISEGFQSSNVGSKTKEMEPKWLFSAGLPNAKHLIPTICNPVCYRYLEDRASSDKQVDL
jgi:hypothetical protein